LKVLRIIILFFICLQAYGQVLINEVKVNPPGADEKYEFIEIRSTPNSTLNNIYVCVIEGDSANPGVMDRVFRIVNTPLGNSGLLLLATSLGYSNVPADCVFRDTLAFAIPGGIIENGSNTYASFFSPVPFVEGSDYDTDNDGQLELPTGAIMMDAVGWTNGNASAVVYGGVEIFQSVGTPDAAVRFFSNTTPLNQSAWYCGDLTGQPSSLTFDPLEVSANFPASGAILTPGAHNQPGFSSVPEIFRKSGVLVFPNPAEDEIRVDLSGLNSIKFQELRIYDSHGKECVRFNDFSNNDMEAINIRDLPSGYYHLEWISDEIILNSKFIKTVQQ
jgi:hypothetical protein